MNKVLIYTFLAFSSFQFLSCEKKSSSTENKSETDDSMTVEKSSLDSNFVLENITTLTAFEDISNKFGNQNITKDTTISGPEGSKLVVSVLFPKTANEVVLYWKEKQQLKKLHSAVVNCDSVGYKGKWHSKLGLQPGISLEKVVELNGKPFTISGFGWDYGGHIISWEGGKLDNQRQTGRFSDFGKNKISDQERLSIGGDTEFNVSLEAIKKMNPTLSQLTVFTK